MVEFYEDTHDIVALMGILGHTSTEQCSVTVGKAERGQDNTVACHARKLDGARPRVRFARGLTPWPRTPTGKRTTPRARGSLGGV